MATGGQSASGASASTGPRHYQIVIVGGGAAGISVAARLCRKLDRGAVAIVEPSAVHYYQPMWTLVGGVGMGSGMNIDLFPQSRLHSLLQRTMALDRIARVQATDH